MKKFIRRLPIYGYIYTFYIGYCLGVIWKLYNLSQQYMPLMASLYLVYLLIRLTLTIGYKALKPQLQEEARRRRRK